MKVKDLIKLLGEYDEEDLVVLAKDGEGNDFSPLSDSLSCKYKADSTWSGEIFSGDEEDDAPEGSVDACVLWPTN